MKTVLKRSMSSHGPTRIGRQEADSFLNLIDIQSHAQHVGMVPETAAT
jgi:hypothetical protein